MKFKFDLLKTESMMIIVSLVAVFVMLLVGLEMMSFDAGMIPNEVLAILITFVLGTIFMIVHQQGKTKRGRMFK